MSTAVVISCEHATAAVPVRYRSVFRGAVADLCSHRGSDLGARALARQLAHELEFPLVEAHATRLLADANRSLGHRHLFSEWSRQLNREDRCEVIARYWQPHREAVERELRSSVSAGATALHVSVHTFTPQWRGVRRNVDVALLYDPRRVRERAFAVRWLGELARLRTDLRLRRNQPYRGNTDGLTTHLRGTLRAGQYLGIELEVSQHLSLGPAAAWRRLRSEIRAALQSALSSTGEVRTRA